MSADAAELALRRPIGGMPKRSRKSQIIDDTSCGVLLFGLRAGFAR
jgi:hypothetical protein